MVGAVAAGLGHTIRVLLWFAAKLPLLVGVGLILYGLSLMDVRAAYIAGGILLIFLLNPRPTDRRRT